MHSNDDRHNYVISKVCLLEGDTIAMNVPSMCGAQSKVDVTNLFPSLEHNQNPLQVIGNGKNSGDKLLPFDYFSILNPFKIPLSLGTP